MNWEMGLYCLMIAILAGTFFGLGWITCLIWEREKASHQGNPDHHYRRASPTDRQNRL